MPRDEWAEDQARRDAEHAATDNLAMLEAILVAEADQRGPDASAGMLVGFDVARGARFGDHLDGPARRAFDCLLPNAAALAEFSRRRVRRRPGGAASGR